jgi:uncharacterized protein YkwD
MSTSPKSHKKSLDPATLKWRYLLFITVLLVARPTTHFISQFLRGYPLDIHYFLSELTPSALFGGGLYNGSGGADWKIGQPLATAWNAHHLRSLSEARTFALQLVNRDRRVNGLPALVEDPLLSEAAQRHAQDMLNRHYFDHVTPEGKTPRDRFIAVGGNSRVGVGENIRRRSTESPGLTYQILEESQRGWMYSNGHRENLLRPEYTKFGYGIVVGAVGRTYAVQMFAMPETLRLSNSINVKMRK